MVFDKLYSVSCYFMRLHVAELNSEPNSPDVRHRLFRSEGGRSDGLHAWSIAIIYSPYITWHADLAHVSRPVENRGVAIAQDIQSCQTMPPR